MESDAHIAELDRQLPRDLRCEPGAKAETPSHLKVPDHSDAEASFRSAVNRAYAQEEVLPTTDGTLWLRSCSVYAQYGHVRRSIRKVTHPSVVLTSLSQYTFWPC